MPNETHLQSTTQPNVKQQIMLAAGQLFADKGFDATSISDITDAAGVARALIYYYFKDKRDLYDTILQVGGEQIINVAERAYASEGNSLDRLRQFAAQFRQLHIDNPNLARIAMRAELEGSLAFDVQAREHFNPVLSVLARIVEEGVARGELCDVDPRKTIHMMMGLIHSLVVMQIQGESDSPDTDIDFAMSLLARGIATRK
jgi:AcrR family transcriptional regulator